VLDEREVTRISHHHEPTARQRLVQLPSSDLGPGLGDVSSGFMYVSDPAKWVAVIGMLLGRLEIFTLLVLITPTFWRT